MGSLSYFLYSLLLAAGMLLSLPYWLYQVLRHGKYRSGLAERLGRVPARLTSAVSGQHAKRVIWVHAVSVGEVTAVSGLVEEMRRGFPQHRVVVTTTTDTGQELARARFGESPRPGRSPPTPRRRKQRAPRSRAWSGARL